MLLLLLAMGILTAEYMTGCHRNVQDTLALAAKEAEVGNWQPAQAHLLEAEAHWEEKWEITAALSDHEPMEHVNDLFAQLEVYARERDSVGFRVLCARLAEALDAIGEAHSVAWWNLA